MIIIGLFHYLVEFQTSNQFMMAFNWKKQTSIKTKIYGMHKKHPVSRFSFQTNGMKNKKLEKWLVNTAVALETLETIFSLGYIHFNDITESLSVFQKKPRLKNVLTSNFTP